MPTLNRRRLLTALATLPLAAGIRGEQPATPTAFVHGVASGDPDHHSVVLWTRIETTAPTRTVDWQIARDAGFETLIATGTVTAGVHRDHTVKVIAAGLEPGTRYHYRFVLDGEFSPVGRTRTLPIGSPERLGIALASCSNHAFGHFNGYAAIARDPGVEFVLHTGDYIYEYGADGWGGETARRLGRVHEPAHEIVTLADYRLRHAQYKRDAGSQAMHAAHPLIALWDDHETTNNPWTAGAQNHQPEEGLWRDRRTASLRAYFEWMPIRDPAPGTRRRDYWRSYRFGDLANLITLESRHSGRAEQIYYAAHMDRIRAPEEARAFERRVLGRPGREMLSPAMTAFLQQQLAASVGDGVPWRLIGNAMPMARMPVPDLAAMGIPRITAAPESPVPDLFWKGRMNLPFYEDTWDGYPWARERFYDTARAAGAHDLLVLTGDSHSFWTNALHGADGQPMGIEIGTAGISSPGDFVESGFPPDVAARIDRAFEQTIPEVLWTDNLHQGYVRVELERDRAQVTYRAVNTLDRPDPTAFDLRRIEILRQGDGRDGHRLDVVDLPTSG